TTDLDGEAVNCVNVADPEWWEVQVGFKPADWNLDRVNYGYLPVPTGNSDAASFNCMTTLLVSDPRTGPATLQPQSGMPGTTLPIAGHTATQSVHRYPATTSTALTYAASGFSSSRVADLSLSNVNGNQDVMEDQANDFTYQLPVFTQFDATLTMDNQLTLTVKPTTCDSSSEIYFFGAGTDSDPYILSNGNDLNCLRQLVNGGITNSSSEAYAGKNYRLIDYANLTNFSITGDGWTPIGNTASPFSGSLIGCDGGTDCDNAGPSSIYGYKIESTDSLQGLFGVIKGATIANLLISGIVSGTDSVGGLAGQASASSTITNIMNYGNITGANSVGGIAGQVESSTVSNCYNQGDITGEKMVGGLVGTATGPGSDLTSIISAANAAENIKGDSLVGGLVGETRSGVSISNVYNSGNVSASDSLAGGITATLENSGIENAYNVGTISANQTYVAGIVPSSSNYQSNANYLNLGDVIGAGSLYGVADSSANGYRWQGVSSNSATFVPFSSTSSTNDPDGLPINCSILADQAFWTGTNSLYFTESEWDWTGLGSGTLPIPKGLSGLIIYDRPNYNCMTQITTDDPLNAPISSYYSDLIPVDNLPDGTSSVYRYQFFDYISAQTFSLGNEDHSTQSFQKYIKLITSDYLPQDTSKQFEVSSTEALPYTLNYTGTADETANLLQDTLVTVTTSDTPFKVTCDDGGEGKSAGIGQNYGTSGDPFEISDVDDLDCMRKLVNNNDWGFNQDGTTFTYREGDVYGSQTIGKYWKIIANEIDLSGYKSDTGWTPIGNASNRSFTGSVYAPGTDVAKISNLTINASSDTKLGLFGYVESGSFANLVLADVDIKAQSQVGGLIGYVASSLTASNILVSGTISSAECAIG
ncbi:MAG: hypothetical protein LBC43_03280, partial [Bifidobacteriaceae bacterium]|nr:hypothetical protein [Bifidobacteriaceae bacterium]